MVPKPKPSENRDSKSQERKDHEQDWFWSKRWQDGEREAKDDIKAGRVETFDTMDEFLATLDDDE
jgi:hypothetical protein